MTFPKGISSCPGAHFQLPFWTWGVYYHHVAKLWGSIGWYLEKLHFGVFRGWNFLIERCSSMTWRTRGSCFSVGDAIPLTRIKSLTRSYSVGFYQDYVIMHSSMKYKDFDWLQPSLNTFQPSESSRRAELFGSKELNWTADFILCTY